MYQQDVDAEFSQERQDRYDMNDVYGEIQSQDSFSIDSDQVQQKKKSSWQQRRARLHKISYECNMLCNMSEEDGSLIDAIAMSTQLGIFETDLVMELIDYRWFKFAQRIHVIGMVFHFVYILVQSLFINQTYAGSTMDHKIPEKSNPFYLLLLAVILIYPLIYDGKQLIMQGPKKYFKQVWNFIDIFHIIGGYLSIFLQLNCGPKAFVCQLLLQFLVLTMLFKLFFFLRVFKRFSTITTMIFTSMYDLRVFLLFFSVLCIFISLAFATLGKNDDNEYRNITPLFRSVIFTLRLAIADFNYGSLDVLTKEEVPIWWVVWILATFAGCLIFLNFIIAEAQNSYQKVKESINSRIYKERAIMVMEVEDFMSTHTKEMDKELFPKYIVIRETEAKNY